MLRDSVFPEKDLGIVGRVEIFDSDDDRATVKTVGRPMLFIG